MSEFNEHRASAIRYWERKRIWYNLALIPPALLGYFSGTFAAVVIDEAPARLGWTAVATLFLTSAIGANICFSLAYALEFLWGSSEPNSAWIRSRRGWVWLMGTLFAMLLSLFGGRAIGLLQMAGLRF